MCGDAHPRADADRHPRADGAPFAYTHTYAGAATNRNSCGYAHANASARPYADSDTDPNAPTQPTANSDAHTDSFRDAHACAGTIRARAGIPGQLDRPQLSTACHSVGRGRGRVRKHLRGRQR